MAQWQTVARRSAKRRATLPYVPSGHRVFHVFPQMAILQIYVFKMLELVEAKRISAALLGSIPGSNWQWYFGITLIKKFSELVWENAGVG
jgi:hypothetical protein